MNLINCKNSKCLSIGWRFAALMIALLVCRSTVVVCQEKTMQNLSDEQVVNALLSQNWDDSDQAVQEIMKRGERMIPILLLYKGNNTIFNGSLGDSSSAQAISRPSGNNEHDEGRVITVEVAALYLISAIYHGTIEFAQSPYLTDTALASKDRRAFNSRELIERAWASAISWANELKKEGIETLRCKQRDPFKGSHVSFW